jgi:hypothetical protein
VRAKYLGCGVPALADFAVHDDVGCRNLIEPVAQFVNRYEKRARNVPRAMFI